MPQTVELSQMLRAREIRAARQRELLAQYGKPLVWFTMNIAGPVKTRRLIRPIRISHTIKINENKNKSSNHVLTRASSFPNL